MALNQASCAQRLREAMDSDFGSFQGFNNTEAEAISCWKDVFQQTVAAVTPSSSTAMAAAALFETLAVGMSDTVLGGAVFLAAWNAATVVLGNGMSGYNVSSPTFLVTDFQAGGLTSDPLFASNTMAANIVARFQTGQATNTITMVTVNWS